MRKFAKLFGPDTDQVLAVRGHDDDGKHEIRFYFQPKNPAFGLSHVATKFGPSDVNGMQADLVFDKLDEAAARKVIASAVELTA